MNDALKNAKWHCPESVVAQPGVGFQNSRLMEVDKALWLEDGARNNVSSRYSDLFLMSSVCLQGQSC